MGAEVGDEGDAPLRQLATLNRIARIAVQDMEVRPMLQRIVDALHEEFGWEFVACASVDPLAGEFRCEAMRSTVATEVAVGYHRKLGSGIVGECAQTGRTIDVEDITGHPNFVDTLHGTRAELCVPVVHNGEVLAVLNAESRRVGAFRGQRALLETVADQIAGVLRAGRLLEELQRANAQLREAYAALEDLSQNDSLTGVANRRCFDGWLAQALDDAATARAPLGLMLLDIDHFKDYNDDYGHVAGDSCLREVAALLEYVLQGTDMRLARYGGEEFVVILPGTDHADALAVAQRLRLAVEARGFEHRSVAGGHLTVSIGVGCCRPVPGLAAASLIGLADAALYDAKRAGRNRVATARA